ncbi:hypothetical protein D3C76_1426230 [compost metagenome]
MHRRTTAADLAEAGADPGNDLRRNVLKFVNHQMRQRSQQFIAEEFEVFRRVLTEQGEHAVVGHDRRFLVEQVILQGPPI